MSACDTFYVSRSTRAEVEIWRTFSLSNANINRKRPRIAEIVCHLYSAGRAARWALAHISSLYRKPNRGQGDKLAEYVAHHIFRVVSKSRHVMAPVQMS